MKLISLEDQALEATVKEILDQKTKPQGSLGRIEELALQLALITRREKPRIQSCQFILFAADHGLADEPISAFPKAVTREMVKNFLNKGAASNVFAQTLDINFKIVDAGIATPLPGHPDLISRRLGPGTCNALHESAMSGETFKLAFEHGMDLMSQSKADVVGFGEMGIGNTSASALVAAKILALDVEMLAGPGTGLKDEGLHKKVSVLKNAAARTAPSLGGKQALQEYGGFEMAMMAGAMIGAASLRRPILVDGFIASASALAACSLEPHLKDYLIFAHKSEERGHQLILEHFGVKPLLDLNLRLGEGTGAMLAWPLVKAASAIICNMASFADASVSGAIEP